MATLALAACVGSAASTEIPSQSAAWLGAAAVAAATMSMVLKRRKLIAAAVAVGLVVCGFAVSDLGEKRSPWLVQQDGDLVRVDGRVMGSVVRAKRTRGAMRQFDYRESTTRFTIRATTPERELDVSVRVDGTANAASGDLVTCTGWLRSPRPRENPGDYFRRSIKPTLFVPKADMCTKTNDSRVSLHNEARMFVTRLLLTGVSKWNESLTHAVFLGNRDGDWVGVSRSFRRSGLAHLLAISGLHIAIVASIIGLLAAATLRGVRSRVMFVLVVVLAQVWIVVPRIPVIRAGVVVALLCSGRILGQRVSGIGLLSLAAIIILATDSTAASTTGFQLSFTVVLGLCLLYPRARWRLLGPEDDAAGPPITIIRGLASMWLVGLTAWMVAAPFVVQRFGSVAPIGILLNVPATVLLAVLLCLGCLQILLGWIDPTIALTIGAAINATATSLREVAEFGSTVPLGFIPNIEPYPWWWLPAMGWVMWWGMAIQHRGRMWCCLPLVILPLWIPALFADQEGFRMDTLAVGHGTCHVIRSGNTSLLVDAGSKSNLDVGLNTVVPALRELGLRKLDAILLTHADLDHCAGLVDVMHHIPVGKLLVSPQAMAGRSTRNSPLSLVLATASVNGVGVEEAVAGRSWRMEGLHVSIIAPRRDLVATSSNAASVVTFLEIHGRTIMLTGDLDEVGIDHLRNTWKHPVDVLEMPHHGQWSASAESLIHQWQPLVLLQSTSAARSSRDPWVSLPADTERLVTAIDGALHTTVAENGTITVKGTHLPGRTILIPPLLQPSAE